MDTNRPSSRFGIDTKRTAARRAASSSVTRFARYTTTVGSAASVVSITIVPETATAASALCVRRVHCASRVSE